MKNTFRKIKLLCALCVPLCTAAQAQDFIVTKSFTGSWYQPALSGQGFLLEIAKSNNQKIGLLSWYTFDNAGNHMWLIGTGSISGQQIVFNMTETTGGRFGLAHDPASVSNSNWGTVTFNFTDCNNATVNWNPVASGFSNGSMQVVRLTNINNLVCTGGLSDDLGDVVSNTELLIPLNNTGLEPLASGKAKYEERADRVEFSVEVEDLTAGSYDLLVGGELKGSIEVVTIAGGTEGEIEFRDPVEPGKILLDFDPRGQDIDVAQGGAVYLTSTIPGGGGNTPPPGGGNTPPPGSGNPPPTGNSEIREFMSNTGVYPAGQAKLELEQRPDRVDFKVEIEDVPVGFYDFFVAGEMQGVIEVIASAAGVEGELEFRNPVEPGKELLDFNPIGELVEVVQDGQVIFTHVFADGGTTPPPGGGGNTPPPGGGGNTPPPTGGTPTEIEVPLNNLGVDPDASGEIDYEVRDDRIDFKVEVEDLDDGSYELVVGNAVVTNIQVVAGEGEVEFRDPPEPGKLPLTFDPLGQEIKVQKDGVVYLSAVLQ